MPTAPEGGKGGHGSVRDWSKIREEIEDKGLPVEAYPVVVGDEGPMWVPLDSKGVTCLIEVMEKKGLRSPLTLNVLESLTGPGPLLTHDIVNLMRMVLKPMQYILWKEEWMSECRKVAVSAEEDVTHPAHSTDVQRHTHSWGNGQPPCAGGQATAWRADSDYRCND